MKHLNLVPALVLVVAIAVGCAPGDGRSTSSGAVAPPVPQRTLRVIARVEAPTASETVNTWNRMTRTLFSAGLSAVDSNGVTFPVLAESVPSLNDDSWRVFPDGRMETTFHLRKGLVWHDGTPLTADDFVFGRSVQLARIGWGHVGPSPELQTLMEDVTAPDPETLVIRWRAPYPDADRVGFLPFPRHLLAAPLAQGESQAFGSLPYWTSAYVGAGPYRVAQWVPGSFVEALGFEGYALGKPIIDRVELTFGADQSVNVVRLLAGAVDVALDGSLQYEEAVTLRREWARRPGGAILLSPTQLRYLQVQHRPEYQKTPALLDLRVRQALLYALDRQALADALMDGEGTVAEGMVPSTVPYYSEVDRAITRYPYDPNRSRQLLGQAGFSLGSDGFYIGPTGRLSPLVQGAEGEEAQGATIIADLLRRAGVDAQLYVYPAELRNQTDEFKGTFAGLATNYNTLTSAGAFGFGKLISSAIGGPDTQWRGGNRIGWSNPEHDRLYDAWTRVLNRAERDQYMVQMARNLSEVLPVYPLYLGFEVVAHTAGLRGPLAGDLDATPYYNIHQWRWE